METDFEDLGPPLRRVPWANKSIKTPVDMLEYLLVWDNDLPAQNEISDIMEDAATLTLDSIINRELTIRQTEEVADWVRMVLEDDLNPGRREFSWILMAILGEKVVDRIGDRPERQSLAGEVLATALALWYGEDIGHVRDRYNLWGEKYLDEIQKDATTGGGYVFNPLKEFTDKVDSVVQIILELNPEQANYVAIALNISVKDDPDGQKMTDGYEGWASDPAQLTVSSGTWAEHGELVRNLVQVLTTNFSTNAERTKAFNEMSEAFRHFIVDVDVRFPDKGRYIPLMHPLVAADYQKVTNGLQYKDDEDDTHPGENSKGRVPTNYTDSSQGFRWGVFNFLTTISRHDVSMSRDVFEQRYRLTWGKADANPPKGLAALKPPGVKL